MTKSVKFDDDAFIQDARTHSEKHNRSLADQIMYWARIGRAVENSDDFDEAKVSRALSAQLETTALSAMEGAVWLERFTEKMGKPGPDEEVYFANMRKRREASGSPPSES